MSAEWGVTIKIPKKVGQVVEIMHEKHARDVVVIKLARLASFTDYFIIGTGETISQVKAIAAELVERMPRKKPLGREGYPAGPWVLLDYGDMIIHLFLPEARSFYELEKAWHDAPMLKIEENEAGKSGPEKAGEAKKAKK